MPRGGARPGSGPKKGTKQKRTLERLKEATELREKMETEGETTPLQFLLNEMNNEELPLSVRHRAAVEAAPYLHSKMPIMNVSTTVEISHEEWLDQLIGPTEDPILIEGVYEADNQDQNPS